MHIKVENTEVNNLNSNIKRKKRLKMISSFSILLLIMLILMLVSWVLYWSKTKTELVKTISFDEWKYDSILKPTYDSWTSKHTDLNAGNSQTWIDFMSSNSSLGWIYNNQGWIKEGYLIQHSGDAVFKGLVTIQPIGLVDVIYAPIKGFVLKSNIIIFTISIGAFLYILVSTKALEGLSQAIIAKLKGKEAFAIIPLMLFFSIFGSVEGFAEETLGFYMIFVPIMLMAGFDVFTGVLILMVGAGTGVIGSTVNPFTIPIAVSAINSGIDSSTVKLTIGDGLIWRIICWLLLTSFSTTFTLLYALKVKKNPSKSVTFSTLEGDKEFFLAHVSKTIKLDWKKKVSLIVFAISFLVMIFYLVGWDSIFNSTKMAEQAIWIKRNIPYLTAFIPGWGNGDLDNVASFFLLASIILAFVNSIGEAAFIKKWFEGASDILSVAFIIATAAGVGYILVQTNLQSLFVKGILSSIGGINNQTAKVIVLFIVFIPLAFLIPSSSGFATTIFPLLAKSLVDSKTNQLQAYASSGSIMAFTFAIGLVNLITPTSGVVMGACSLSRMSYAKYLKAMLLLILYLFILCFILLLIGGALPNSIS
ncbi:YfcC family protein [Mycoplasma capricolum subsp. capripneumoniae]|uniref:C4-dicarboxylate ABC transporter n=1 Tax=Mycoplasma capricolum subsp. capripneumoniae 87001 TaxID=1124992 RepID=A0A9N7G917_MYCCC|nr:YfcC family protein [Mycoplasma capricolum]AJK51830.1 C4-dicarboxylate ABC transporter [Mycoplasma capricolum subsp. capripneumoniae 87001]AQU77742.1 C4-dicarboxylate ABC transporter [Mycoplasma capricolum subsp. capripneumoniae]KEY84765.1 putative membrane arginine transporter [Mycoplasma capricolum subsp. capripneumoniae 99108]QDL19885.1 YfcC family protein [Mycoplasma capricolum subsp. capripneumoniae]QDL20570.1 YfcC family protein [Mycoplasma capricolum subsp. capripneumoniae]